MNNMFEFFIGTILVLIFFYHIEKEDESDEIIF